MAQLQVLKNFQSSGWDEVRVSSLRKFFDAVMKVNSLRTLRLKLNDSSYISTYDLSELLVKSPSLELIELTICRGIVHDWLETLKWEKQ